ncbi:Esterase TesA precursor [Novipirellula aureliae]|uniref:Esterase TesA n=2 Tax=Novipirellula aureliae TaxID=2527966 RepID=A0A5C6DUW0_9BACT|nr:Esterase TesA precursor [Novipirellula aureliae]
MKTTYDLPAIDIPAIDQRRDRYFTFLMLICLQFAVDAAFAWSAPPLDTPAKPRVVCFGDSITKRGYPQILARLTGFDAINAGVAGNSTAKALRRLADDVLAQKPHVVVILFGTNDLRADADHAYVPVAQYKANLESIVAQCRKQKARVILCTLPPIEHEAFFIRHQRDPFEALGGLAKLIENYREAASQVAADQNAPLVDLNQLLAKEPQWLSKDGVHPSEAGNAIIAKHVARVLAPLFADQRRQMQPSADDN